MTAIAEPDFPEQGRVLFAGPCDFIFASAKAGDLPPVGPPEIAFAGRSNVGKSSLLNALTNRKTLARVSHTPGRTQQLNFFALGGAPGAERLRLVDMPGYGYAAVGKEKVASWSALMRDYLKRPRESGARLRARRRAARREAHGRGNVRSSRPVGRLLSGRSHQA